MKNLQSNNTNKLQKNCNPVKLLLAITFINTNSFLLWKNVLKEIIFYNEKEEESISKTSLDNQYSYITEHSSDYDEFEL